MKINHVRLLFHLFRQLEFPSEDNTVSEEKSNKAEERRWKASLVSDRIKASEKARRAR
jgi:predicted GIY-YIG superfamily endonuclease